MNRKERRRLERKGITPKAEPTYTLKPSDVKNTILNGPGHEVFEHEARQKLLELDKQFALDVDTMVLWTLHKHYGFGPKRAKEFYTLMFKEHQHMREYYEMDDLYPERHKLKEAGIDVEAWFNELFDENGNFKKPEEVSL